MRVLGFGPLLAQEIEIHRTKDWGKVKEWREVWMTPPSTLPVGFLVLGQAEHLEERGPSSVRRLAGYCRAPCSTPKNVSPHESQNEEYQAPGSRLVRTL